jgi:hypothetical protein
VLGTQVALLAVWEPKVLAVHTFHDCCRLHAACLPVKPTAMGLVPGGDHLRSHHGLWWNLLASFAQI